MGLSMGAASGQAEDQGALVGGILVAVAARLRAGQSPGEAWRASLEDKPDEVVRALHSVVPEAGGGAAGGQVRGLDIAARTAIASAGAATDVARTLGAELAGVLQACAEGIEEAARATADRVAALSGPRSTARLLMGLPLAGLILGVVMGAKPLGFLTGTWWGALVLAMALMLTIIGHWWIRRLIDRAALTERAVVSLRER